MKNIVFVTKVDGDLRKKCFIDLSNVVAVGLPEEEETFPIYFHSEVWNISTDEFEYVIRYWNSNENSMTKYFDYINNK